MQPRSNPRLPPIGGSSSIFGRLTSSILLVLAFLGMATISVLVFGRCAGEEFSVGGFARRTFYYFRIPVVKLQVTPIFRHPTSSALVKHLKSKQLIPSIPSNWQLASLQAGLDQQYESDELILCRYLEQRNSDYDLRWLVWSQKNPRLAHAFWPIIARVAQEGLCLLVPELFEIARYASDPVRLDRQLRASIVNDASRFAAGQYQLANYDRAAQIAAFVLAVADDEQRRDDKEFHNPQYVAAVKSASDCRDQAIKRGGKPITSSPVPVFVPQTDDSNIGEEEYPDAEPVELDE